MARSKNQKLVHSLIQSSVSLAIFLSSTLAMAAPRLDFGGVQVVDVRVDKDCLAQDVQVSMAPDASAITILYDRFEASATPANRNVTKQCHVTVTLNSPKINLGFAKVPAIYSVETVDNRGYLFLEGASQATQLIEVENGYSEAGRLNLTFGAQAWQGPFDNEYIVQAKKPLPGLKYLGCFNADKKQARIKFKTKLNINHRANHGESLFMVDSSDGKISQTFRLGWFSPTSCLGIRL